MNIAEYLMETLYKAGVTHCFTVIGGGAIHLNNALAHSKITPIYMHHESACGFAAEGYARLKGIGACLVTTGPGSTNAITACLSCWTDSVPVLFISGQVKRAHINYTTGLRQLGDQECNIIDMVKGITKVAIEVTSGDEIVQVILYLLKQMLKGRKGPVWLSIPIDVQNQNIDLFTIGKTESPIIFPSYTLDSSMIQSIQTSQKPVLIIGQGVRLANAIPELVQFLQTQPNLPVLLSFEGMDILPENHPNYLGRFGIIGQRAGNKILMTADVVICIGTRLNVRAMTYEPKNFAPQAQKIIVDIDNAELQKFTFPCEKLCLDAKIFLSELCKLAPMNHEPWITECRKLKSKYPKFDSKITMDIYRKMNELSKNSQQQIVVVSNGFACISVYQSWEVKPDQRILMNSGTASMGWALSAAIGAYFATNKPVLCIEGDGSIMMNLSSIYVLTKYQLPIEVVLIDNAGYNSIKLTERAMNASVLYGSNLRDLYFPNWVNLFSGEIGVYTILQTDPSQDYFVKVASHLENGKWVSDTLDNMSPHEEDTHDQ